MPNTNGKIKGSIDDTRLINTPHLNFNPTGIYFHVGISNETPNKASHIIVWISKKSGTKAVTIVADFCYWYNRIKDIL